MCLALELKRCIEFCEDAGLGLVEREHHFQMRPQQFATILSTVGSFRRSSRRGEKEDVIVLQSKPWVLVNVEQLVKDALHDPNFVSFTFNGERFIGWASIVIPFGNSRVVLDCRI